MCSSDLFGGKTRSFIFLTLQRHCEMQCVGGKENSFGFVTGGTSENDVRMHATYALDEGAATVHLQRLSLYACKE